MIIARGVQFERLFQNESGAYSLEQAAKKHQRRFRRRPTLAQVRWELR